MVEHSIFIYHNCEGSDDDNAISYDSNKELLKFILRNMSDIRRMGINITIVDVSAEDLVKNNLKEVIDKLGITEFPALKTTKSIHMGTEKIIDLYTKNIRDYKDNLEYADDDNGLRKHYNEGIGKPGDDDDDDAADDDKVDLNAQYEAAMKARSKMIKSSPVSRDQPKDNRGDDRDDGLNRAMPARSTRVPQTRPTVREDDGRIEPNRGSDREPIVNAREDNIMASLKSSQRVEPDDEVDKRDFDLEASYWANMTTSM